MYSNQFILETQDLSKTIHHKQIIKQCHLIINKGSIYGLIGPNGSGKSTLLKMLSGIWKPSNGTILLNGHKLNRKNISTIGSLIEHPALYDNLTAIENLQVRALLLDIPKQRCLEVLEIMKLTQVAKQQVATFSLGMKQRLGIALALLNGPQLLLLDEPTNGLDPIGIDELKQQLISWRSAGMSILISSHMLNVVQSVADDIGIIYQGEILFQGENKEDLESLFYQTIKRKEVPYA